MHEIELKFQVPPDRGAAVDAAVAGRTAAARTRLQAIYFDTADRRLAAAHMALRIRREGRQWVQTLKGSTGDGMTRLEHNVPRGAAASVPNIEPQLHAGTPAGDKLLALLAPHSGGAVDGGNSKSGDRSAEAMAPALAALYRTDILRRTRAVRTARGRVELALDTGKIVAGDKHIVVRELEIELLFGSPLAVLDTAPRWMRRFGLWLDMRSKAERGDMLARMEAMAPPRTASSVRLTSEMSATAAWQAVLRSCADHITVNASQIASGEHSDEHVHQLRVGLRRLRSALSLFDGDVTARKPADPATAQSSPQEVPPVESPKSEMALANVALAPAAADLFRRLGGARDLAVIEGEFAGELIAAMRVAGVSSEAPTIARAGDETPPANVVRETANQMFLLDLLAAIHADLRTDVANASTKSLSEQLARRLNQWHRQFTAEAKHFVELDDSARHRLRKRAKRLRYAVEFCASLFERRKVRRYLKKLRALQERLGSLSDVVMAIQAFGRAGESDPRAMFALGWLAARRDILIKAAQPELEAFIGVDRFWK